MQAGKMPENFKPLSYKNKGGCFGCGTGNTAGLQMEFATDGKSLVSQLSVPAHLCGWQNLVHGGITATILDETMGWTAIYLLRRLVLTKTMKVDFLKPLFVNQQLHVEGRVVEEIDARQALIKGEIYNPAGDLCAGAEGVFALFTVDAARNLGFLDATLIDEIETTFQR